MNIYSFTSFQVWLRAMGIYALLTLPAMAFAPVYLISIILALGWSVPGAIVFALVLRGLSIHLPTAGHSGWRLLAAALLATGCALLAVWHVSRGDSYWQWLYDWALFPLAAVLSAILGVLSSKRLLLS